MSSDVQVTHRPRPLDGRVSPTPTEWKIRCHVTGEIVNLTRQEYLVQLESDHWTCPYDRGPATFIGDIA